MIDYSNKQKMLTGGMDNQKQLQQSNNKKKVSVVVPAYNHQKYINECLESILNQRGDFSLEVILGDDCSTDNTRQIMQTYVEKYPYKYILLSPLPNLGVTKNIKRCLEACTGEFIAFCEGDDYWTDPYKLQKQMEFLETHIDYSLCFNAFLMYFESENKYSPFSDQLLLKSDTVSIEDLIATNYIGNFSCCMYRASVIKRLPAGILDIYTVDWMFNMACSTLGKIGFIRDWMSIYRVHPGGAWSGQSGLEQCRLLLSYIDTYNQFFSYQYNEQFIKLKNTVNVYKNSLLSSSNQSSIMTYTEPLILRAIKHPRKAVKKLWTISYDLIKRIVNRLKIFQIKADLIILDTVFPHPLSPFRLQEYRSYLEHFKSALVLTNGDHLPAFKETRKLDIIIDEFETNNPEFKCKTKVISHNIDGYVAKVAYMDFLNIVNAFLIPLERKRIPFVFTLYPGGGFKIYDEKSDSELKRVFESSQFRKVIVTQQLTYDYLINSKLCPVNKIDYIFGVVTPIDILTKTQNYNKISFGFEKKSLDICFVAHKYMVGGIDKGYDVFIDVAKKLVKYHDDVYFHVVGNFSKVDLSIAGLENKITFYGLQSAEWFDQFYKDKDIILCPNIPFMLFKGSFDGFPTACCTEAGLRKVAIFCTDELKLNKIFVDNEEIVIIPHECEKIVNIIESFYKDPKRLRKIGENGAIKIQDIYSYEKQILPRIKILEHEITASK